ncbi:unnamed protein product [Mytilus edulis]|uniref:DNA-directed DNA polymerase n=1 Tax=Mytilus edulis TaxID=6550 RepID=A0A8S3R9F9_MYTED|nr:unnamed protein product [Mytilus edulis]
MLKEEVKRNYSLIINVIKSMVIIMIEKIKCVMFMNFLDVIGMDVQNVIVLKKYVKKDRNKKTMKELYDQTKERLKTIEDYLKPNVKIHTIWECEFDQQKYPEVDPHLKPIDKRDAFYGGRTETIQLYNNLSDLKGRYVDFCSLYPSVNKYCKYPIGHPITYTDISVDDYIKIPIGIISE